jgi:hypothetical protein
MRPIHTRKLVLRRYGECLTAADPSQQRTGDGCPHREGPFPLFFLDEKVIPVLEDVSLFHVQCTRDKFVLGLRAHLDLRLLWNGLDARLNEPLLHKCRCKRTFLSSASFFIRCAVALVFRMVCERRL